MCKIIFFYPFTSVLNKKGHELNRFFFSFLNKLPIMLYVSKILLLANIVYVGAGWKKKKFRFGESFMHRSSAYNSSPCFEQTKVGFREAYSEHALWGDFMILSVALQGVWVLKYCIVSLLYSLNCLHSE